MAKDNGVLPLGLALEGENDDDTRDDAAALFGIDIGDGYCRCGTHGIPRKEGRRSSLTRILPM